MAEKKVKKIPLDKLPKAKVGLNYKPHMDDRRGLYRGVNQEALAKLIEILEDTDFSDAPEPEEFWEEVIARLKKIQRDTKLVLTTLKIQGKLEGD